MNNLAKIPTDQDDCRFLLPDASLRAEPVIINMSDLNTEQKQRAEDLAKGIILAQLSANPALDVRGLLDSPALYSVPHREKVQALRQYADIANHPEFKDRVNRMNSIPEEVLGAAKNTALDAMRTGVAGAGITALASPKLMEGLLHGGRARNLILTSLARPALIAAGIGGAISGIHELSERKQRRDYTRETQEILENIRTQENPNPYINALLLTNRSRLMAANSAMESGSDSRASMREMVPAGLAVVDAAMPGRIPMVEVVHRAFNPMAGG